MKTKSYRTSDARSRLRAVGLLYDDYLKAKERADEYERTISYAKTSKISAMPKKERTMNSFEDKLIKSISYKEEAAELHRKFIAAAEDAGNLIMRLENPVERKLLIMRYIDLQGWNNIIDTLQYERSWVYRMHNRAIANLDIIIKSDLKKRR